MGRKARVVRGEKYGSLTVVREGEKGKYGRRVLCDCDCGKKLHNVNFYNLRSGAVKSCGCKRVKKKKPLFDRNLNTIRNDMKTKCYNKEHTSYKNYGANGIGISEPRMDYYIFAEDMLSSYINHKKEHGVAYLCRKDENEDFSVNNCYWNTRRDTKAYREKIEKGEIFGMLEFIEDIPNDVSGSRSVRMGRFRCGCGKYCNKRIEYVKRGDTKSCGCYRQHGLSDERIYKIRASMKDRCTNPNSVTHKYYLDKGVTFTEERGKFINFYNDMIDSYEEHVERHGERQTTLDRINPHGNYCKENCRRATYKVQANNTRAKYDNSLPE